MEREIIVNVMGGFTQRYSMVVSRLSPNIQRMVMKITFMILRNTDLPPFFFLVAFCVVLPALFFAIGCYIIRGAKV